MDLKELKHKSIVTTKVELSGKTMDILKCNKKINGTAIGWVLAKSVEEYISRHQLEELYIKSTDETI